MYIQPENSLKQRTNSILRNRICNILNWMCYCKQTNVNLSSDRAAKKYIIEVLIWQSTMTKPFDSSDCGPDLILRLWKLRLFVSKVTLSVRNLKRKKTSIVTSIYLLLTIITDASFSDMKLNCINVHDHYVLAIYCNNSYISDWLIHQTSIKSRMHWDGEMRIKPAKRGTP